MTAAARTPVSLIHTQAIAGKMSGCYIMKTFVILPTDRIDYSPTPVQEDERSRTRNPFTRTIDAQEDFETSAYT